MSYAYLVAYLNHVEGTIQGVDIFSEATPTTNLGKIRTTVLLVEEGDTYGEAMQKLVKMVADPTGWYHVWWPYLSERSKRDYEERQRFLSLGVPIYDNQFKGFPKSGLSTIYGDETRHEVAEQVLHHASSLGKSPTLVVGGMSGIGDVIDKVDRCGDVGYDVVVVEDPPKTDSQWSLRMGDLRERVAYYDMTLIFVRDELVGQRESSLILHTELCPNTDDCVRCTVVKSRYDQKGTVEFIRSHDVWPSGVRRLK